MITMSSMHLLASSGDSVKITIDCVGASGLRAFFVNSVILLIFILLASSKFAVNSSMFSMNQFGTPCITIPYSILITVTPPSISFQFNCLNFVASLSSWQRILTTCFASFLTSLISTAAVLHFFE